MAVADVLGPSDIDAAFVRGGKLVILDGRGTPWTYDASVKRKDALGEEIEGPSDFDQVVVFDDKNKRVVVIEGSGQIWTYNAAESEWIKGFNIEDSIEKPEEDKDNPWTKGRNLEARLFNPEELRNAKRVVERADAAEESEKERQKGGHKRSKKEAA